MLFAAVPNVQGTTDVALLSGYVLGPAPGFMVGALAALASNLFLGQGPWTPWQMVGWGAAGRRRRAARGGLAPARGSPARWPAPAPLAGLAFGAWMDLFTLIAFTADPVRGRVPRDRRRLAAVQRRARDRQRRPGLAFGPAFVRVLERFRRRLDVRWESAPARPRGLPARVGGAASRQRVLLIALALAGTARSRPTAPCARGVRYLERAQNRDGGFGGAPGPGLEPADHGLGGARARGRRPPSARRAERGRTPIDFMRARAPAR